MMVHTLELADRAQLSHAFEALLASELLSDCSVELDELRIRFVAPEDYAARVIDQISRHGGLRTSACEWVATHSVLAEAGVHTKRR